MHGIRFLRSIVFLLAIALPASRAPGQGTTGVIAREISVADAVDLADTLELSPDQRWAWLIAHADYAAACARLYEGQIGWLVDHLDALSTNPSEPGEVTLKAYLRRREHASRSLAGVDKSLFDAATAWLTDEQKARLPRVRAARARRRDVDHTLVWFVRGGRVDLTSDAISGALDAESRASLDATFLGYETALTALVAQLHQRATEMYTGIDAELAAQGIKEEDRTDPEQAARVMDARQAAVATLSERALNVDRKIRAINRSTARTIEARLDGPERSRFRAAFIRAAYPEVAPFVDDRSACLTAALEVAGDDTEARTAVMAAESARRSQIRPLVDSVMETVDAFHDEYSMFSMDQAAWLALQAEVEAAGAKIRAADSRARSAIEAILDARVPACGSSGEGADDRGPGSSALAPRNGVPASPAEAASGLVPTPPDEERLRDLAARCGIAWDGDLEDELRATRAACDSARAADDPRPILVEMEEAETRLYEALADRAAEPAALDAIEAARRERGLARLTGSFAAEPAPPYPRFHLYQVLEDADLAPAAHDAIRAGLDERHEEIIDWLGNLRDETIGVSIALRELQADTERKRLDELLPRLNEAREAQRVAVLRLLRLNETQLDDLVPPGADGRDAFVAAYRRRAFPDLAEGDDPSRELIRPTLAGDGLSDADRARLLDLDTAFVACRDRIDDEIIEHHRLLRRRDLLGELKMPEQLRRQARLDRLRFERREAFARTAILARLVLE